jgi:hypothetical protein
MQFTSNPATVTPSKPESESAPKAQNPQYVAPTMYVIGRSHELLQGSGRHKWDDTGSRGFTVDQR